MLCESKLAELTVFLVKSVDIASSLCRYPMVIKDCGGDFAMPRSREVRSRLRQDHVKILISSFVKSSDETSGLNYLRRPPEI